MSSTKTNKRTVSKEKTLPYIHDMLRCLANRASKSCNRITFDEAMSEAYVAYMKACDKWDPDKGASFSTWVHKQVHYRLRDLQEKSWQDEQRLYFMEIREEIVPGQHDFNKDFVHHLLSSISNDAKCMVELLVTPPENFKKELGYVPNPKNPSMWNNFVLKRLRKKGWRKPRIDRAQKEISIQIKKMT